MNYNNFSVNYVVATWSGPRRVKDPRHFEDRSFYINSHIESLYKLKSKFISNYTIVIPNNAAEPDYFRNKIPDSINGVPVEILERPNIGLSYGSFSDAYEMYRINFDYYILMEDDYVFVSDNYDEILLDKINSCKKCGFVCAYYRKEHAAVYLGIASSIAMEKIWKKYGKLPHSSTSEYRLNESEGQIGQSKAFVETGSSILDITDKYKISYRKPNMSIEWFGNLQNPTLIEPV